MSGITGLIAQTKPTQLEADWEREHNISLSVSFRFPLDSCQSVFAPTYKNFARTFKTVVVLYGGHGALISRVVLC